ncbi:MAG: glycine cleavage system aminomethyltransferase GcvT [Verrucomicrobiaceae bacterium]|nr:glycine cleavage system aminomethyltransferase GcvT [Verrucomicrobiaceae bacterium]
MIPFAGWEMPVQYTSITEEHQAVRNACGVFDISHMGQFLVSGKGAEAFLNRALTNDISVLQPGQGQYTLMLNEGGGVIDDLIAYKTSDREFFLVVNASMIDADLAHLKSLLTDDDKEIVQIVNASSLTGGIAVQGPRARDVFKSMMGPSAVFPEKNTVQIAGTEHGIMWLCGTGYTGEEGFELFTPTSRIEYWLRSAISSGCSPCGLGARDTLRLEMGYPLNGNDLSPLRSPLQAGLAFFVEFDKEDFVGKDSLLKQKAAGLPDKLTAFKMTGTCPPPRPHCGVVIGGQTVAEVASGTQSPSLGCGIGMAYLPLEHSAPGTPIEIEIRGRNFPAVTVRKPIYQKPKLA